MSTAGDTSRYTCRAVARACDVLDAFRDAREPLRLKDVADRAGLSLPTTFRILFTLEQHGLVRRIGEKQYRLEIRLPRSRRYRIGYASQSQEFPFSRTVTESLSEAAARAEIDLIVLDNRYSSKAAVRNAETFVREAVELVIEFQTDEHVAPVISSKFLEADIPLIALEIPHPGGTYFGANNYAAGLIGGRYLGRWAAQNWRGVIDEVLLLELPIAGAIPRSRLTGTLAGIREVVPSLDEKCVVWLDGRGKFGSSLEAVRRHLRRSHAKRVLVSAINDPSALGALRAFEEAGRAHTCVVVGQNASLEARAELRKPETRFIASVAYFPERYGERVVALALDILQRKPVPPAVFSKHQLVTPDNVDSVYPNDALINPRDLDILLLRSH